VCIEADEISGREIEAKFHAADTASLEWLLDADEPFKNFSGDSAKVASFVDIYYDTKGYDLIRRGVGLRVRTKLDDAQTVQVAAKGLSGSRGFGIHDRLELQSDVDATSGKPPFLKQASPDLQQAVSERNPNGHHLRPVLALHQTRRTRDLFLRDGREESESTIGLAEISIDDVRVLRVAQDNQASASLQAAEAVAEFRDLELELLPGADLAAFSKLVESARQLEGLQAASRSKLEQGLRILAAASGDDDKLDIQPTMHMAEACRLIWRAQAVEILLQEHGVRMAANGLDDPEYVHDMRVAIRRARSAYELFGHYFRRREVEPVIKGLRRLGKHLGKVRDLDVALENLNLPPKNVLDEESTSISRLKSKTEQQRQDALISLIGWLDTDEHSEMIADLMSLVTTPGKGVRKSVADAFVPRPIQVRHCVPSIILDRFERVRAYESLLESENAASQDQLHALRIQCKYLRYVLEFNRHLLGDEGESLITQLKAMQDHLGELNDCAVETRRLHRWETEDDEATDAEYRIQALAERTAELRETFPPAFREFIREENRRMLGIAITRM
jgi:triphosphatase